MEKVYMSAGGGLDPENPAGPSAVVRDSFLCGTAALLVAPTGSLIVSNWYNAQTLH
jgi:hypothetical protein